MTSDELRTAITDLGFSSINEFGAWLETNERTVRRWTVDGPPAAVAKLLEFMAAEGYSATEVDRSIRAWRSKRGDLGESR